MQEAEVFSKVLIYMGIGIAFMAIGYLTSFIIRKDNPNPEKLTPYECGEDPQGNSHVRFNIRFYVMDLIFLIFDVELVFLFPWATVFGDIQLNALNPGWGNLAFIEMMIFVGILFLGLVYAWKKGDLNWVTPSPLIPQTKVNIPLSLYEKINSTPHIKRPFTRKSVAKEETKQKGATNPAKKPAFKPRVIAKPKSSE